MNNSKIIDQEKHPDTHHDTYSRTIFGFWVYLLSDFILFGVLFATYAVLLSGTYGGPSAGELFDLRSVLNRTIILILCSFTAGLAGSAAHRRKKMLTVSLFGATFLFGMVFMAMQFGEFQGLIAGGHGWQKSAFLSAYFTLLGTFSLHMLFALLWIFVLIIPVCLNGVTGTNIRRLTCLRMFWQFLNAVWVFIFTFVYLLGGK